MNEISTRMLTDILLHTDQDRIDSFRREHLETLTHMSFPGYYEALLREKKLTRSEAIRDSGLEVHYAYQILSGVKHPGRDKLLCLCIGGHLTLPETQRALARAQAAALYPKCMRDALIMLALNRRLHPVWQVNELLAEHHQPLLC